MAATLSDIVMGLSVRATVAESLDLTTRNAALAFARSLALDNGTGANQVDKLYQDTNTLGASATLDIDLVGALTDVFGTAFNFARVKGLFVAAAAANTNNVVVGGAAATQWVGPFGAAAHTIAVRPGGWFGICCADATAWPATGGATDLLRIANSAGGTSVDYSIVLLGSSA
jgi:hypothetical protein